MISHGMHWSASSQMSSNCQLRSILRWESQVQNVIFAMRWLFVIVVVTVRWGCVGVIRPQCDGCCCCSIVAMFPSIMR